MCIVNLWVITACLLAAKGVDVYGEDLVVEAGEVFGGCQ